MTVRRFLCWMLAAASLLVADATFAAGDVFETFTLPNGVRVVLSSHNRYTDGIVVARFHVGARQEVAGRTGLAHFLEHLTFKGDWPGPQGDNASTNFDHTQYHSGFQESRVKHALWPESWRMGDSVRYVGGQEFERERGIVKNERRQRLETQPYGRAEEALFATLFPKPHPYGARVIGTQEDLDALTLAEARAFFEAWYGPNNATIAIVGAFDPADARRWVKEYFADIPARQTPPIAPLPDTPLGKEVVLKLDESIAKTPRLLVAWRSPPRFDRLDAAAELLAVILSGLRTNRLRTGVPEARAVDAGHDAYLASSVFRIVAEPREGIALDDLAASVDAVIERLAAEPPTAAELDAAVRVTLRNRVKRLESAYSEALFTLDLLPHLGGKKPFDFEQTRFLAVKVEDVQEVARTYLRKDRRVVIHSTPVGGAR